MARHCVEHDTWVLYVIQCPYQVPKLILQLKKLMFKDVKEAGLLLKQQFSILAAG